jgi:hypothetical protein
LVVVSSPAIAQDDGRGVVPCMVLVGYRQHLFGA